jgi:hypothetical protein
MNNVKALLLTTLEIIETVGALCVERGANVPDSLGRAYTAIVDAHDTLALATLEAAQTGEGER